MVPFLLALYASAGPSPELGAAADDLNWLAGSWDAEVIDYPEDGPPRRGPGEWHFAWVLEGRALQDVWIVPPRGEREGGGGAGPAGPANRYGSTLRVHDPEAGVWRLTWINPVSGVESRLAGGRVGADHAFEGTAADGSRMRWCFTEIEPESFRWLGESSRDGGGTWRLDSEFRLRRRTAPETGGPSVPPLAGRWRWADRPGLESLEIAVERGEVVADGAVLVVLEGVPTEVRYRLAYDRDWRFLRGTIRSRAATGDPGATKRTLEIAREATPGGDPEWRVDGAPRADLAGCTDVDLMVTPFTNTPPLRSRPLSPGEARSPRVAWVRWPELEVVPVEQEYRRLGDDRPATPGAPERYRYRNLDSDFEGELTVDDDLLVIDYGPWRALR
jgi:hypothetical protein